MVNRTMEAKRIKRINQIKARPRYLKMNNGYMKGQQTVGDLSKIPLHAQALFKYRDRVGEHSEEEFLFVDAILQVWYPDRVPPPPRRPEHIRLQVNLKPPVRNFILQSTRYIKLAMVCDDDLKCIQFLEHQMLPGIIRRSITYGSYDRAMQVFHLQSIRWKEAIQIPNVE